MIAALATIILALAWLAHETDRLRVRLLAGPAAVPEPEIPEVRAAWDTFDWRSMKFLTYTQGNGVVWKTPLCGWDWITGREHIIPEYRVEFAMNGVRHKMHLSASTAAAKLLGEAMKINARPHKPPKLPTSGIRKSKRIRRRRVAVAVG